MTADELRAFSTKMAEHFNAGRIKAPIHLDDGNEEALIRYFRGVKSQDWICGSWRQMYKCLLKGVPPDELEAEVLAGRSISLCMPKYRVISSAMVGGILPIALGIATAVKRKGGEEHVHCFLGDMTALTGTFHECLTYSQNFDLPITWIVEDNDKSVCTPTREVWGAKKDLFARGFGKVYAFSYETKYPHSGAGQRVNF
jgi:pyruvate dehydrogenase E1 component alpha subunit